MAEKKAATPAAKPEAKMYVGPTKFGAVHVVSGTIFKGGKMPDHLAKLAKSNKDFAALVVPVSGLGKAKAQLAGTGSDLGKNYKAFAAYAGEGAAK